MTSFESFADFLAMGGHARYVWLAYGLGLGTIVVSLVSPARARARFFAVEAERLRRDPTQRGQADASHST
jgi:heme exporter protein D